MVVRMPKLYHQCIMMRRCARHAGQTAVSPPFAIVRLKGDESTVSEQTETSRLTGQFSKALVYAELKHHNQVRKGGDIPYVGHLLTVAGLVINDGGSETQAIAALLHDAVEDQGGPPTLEEIRASFGDEVARIVAECSDTDAKPKPPWTERKTKYIAHLAEVGEDTLLVSVADKLDNARSMLRDYHTHGPSLWERFNRKNPQDHLWYYSELLKAYRSRGFDSWMVDELDRVVKELKRLVDGDDKVVLV
jgi:(p)ppGpp synthase/HD superfamily hydrolase